MTVLFHVSDPHFGGEDQAALDGFSAAVAAEKPTVVICTGDLTMAGRRSEFKAAEAWLAAMATPLVVCPGNHDLPVYNLIERLLSPFARFDSLMARIVKPITAPGVTIVPLRTATRGQLRRDWSKGIVRPENLAAAVALAAAAPPGGIVIVACHHPLVDHPDSIIPGKTRGGLTALTALAGAGVDAVLSGHVHDPFDQQWRGGGRPVRLIGAGTLSVRLRATRPSFNRLTITDGKLDVAVQLLN